MEELYDIPVGATTSDLPPGVLYKVWIVIEIIVLSELRIKIFCKKYCVKEILILLKKSKNKFKHFMRKALYFFSK